MKIAFKPGNDKMRNGLAVGYIKNGTPVIVGRVYPGTSIEVDEKIGKKILANHPTLEAVTNKKDTTKKKSGTDKTTGKKQVVSKEAK